jgi:N-acetylglucosaminyl-diphospho-decaprenol L-rhamnosyltransferase
VQTPFKPVTVSVVSHHQADLVQLILQDLRQHCNGLIDKLVLTCNLPEALPFDLQAFGYPIELIANPKPKGFGANHNQAFRHCTSEWFLILNPDVRIDRDVLTELLSLATPKTGILAPQEYSALGEQVENLRGPVTPYELIERHLLKRPGLRPATGWVKGMFMLARTEAFRGINGFDERYFMYCEDFDLCARLIGGGWTVDHHEYIPVTHVWERKSHRSPKHLTYHLASLLRMWSSTSFWLYWGRHRNSHPRT